MDKFERIMNELDNAADGEDYRSRQVFPDKKEKEKRYKWEFLGVTPNCDGISVFQEKRDGLKFAIKVAEFYDCVYQILTHENAPEGGKFELRIFCA